MLDRVVENDLCILTATYRHGRSTSLNYQIPAFQDPQSALKGQFLAEYCNTYRQMLKNRSVRSLMIIDEMVYKNSESLLTKFHHCFFVGLEPNSLRSDSRSFCVRLDAG